MEKPTPQNFFYTRGHLSREEITFYLEDSLSHEDALRIEYHLTDCAMCRATVEHVRTHGFSEIDEVSTGTAAKVRSGLKNSGTSPSRSRIFGIPRRSIPYSAAAVILLICAVGYFGFIRQRLSVEGLADLLPGNDEQIELMKTNAGPSREFNMALEQFYSLGLYSEETADAYAKVREKFMNIPSSDADLYQLAQAYVADIDRLSGNLVSATTGFLKFLDSNPESGDYWTVTWFLADCYYHSGSYDKLGETLRKMKENSSDDSLQKRARKAYRYYQRLKDKGKLE